MARASKKSAKRLDAEIEEALGTRKGAVFYRGTVPGDPRRIETGAADWDSYLFVTDTPENARWYGPRVEAVVLLPEARILYEGTRDFTRVAGRWKKGTSLLEYASHAARQARAAGYDVVHFKAQTDVGTAILRREIVAARQPYKGA